MNRSGNHLNHVQWRLIPLALCLALPGGNPCAAGPTAPAASVTADEQAILAARLQEVRQLLTTLDGLETHLTSVAQRALDQSDAAPTLDERRRYEQLYTETSARLGELRITRRNMQDQLDRLDAQLDAASSER
ncbi:hypothetical protein [Thiobaca trueperi]|uniref:Uncharacterized protein n=1 Tax=Thiobaca trueperi TaxID=127458 RepID=A0A4R3N607_9GAMM|nr:hypothetical protein [Thiobaca trueperi]TCT23771.1 hypothetical protein EDC35_10184 [Thiobaca trueperi]